MKTIIFIIICCLPHLLFSLIESQPPSNINELSAGLSKEKPLMISSLANLRWLSETKEAWGSKDRKVYYLQTEDIDATETKFWNDCDGFIPIAFNYTKFFVDEDLKKQGTDNCFYGVYDGNNMLIQNLYINLSKLNYMNKHIGLFSRIDNTVLTNIIIDDILISNSKYSSIGALVCDARNSKINNVSVSGTIIVNIDSNFATGLIGNSYNSDINECNSIVNFRHSNDGSVPSVISGLVYLLSDNSILRNSFFNGSIDSQSENIAGLVWFLDTSLMQCCYFTTNEKISYSNTPTSFIAVVCFARRGKVESIYFDKEKTGLSELVLFNVKSKVKYSKSLRSGQMKISKSYRGFDFKNTWDILPDVNNNYPHIRKGQIVSM